ncbi:MAG: hypothetical protein N3I35_18245 [Clostridia bacterium]|nr:hypothetical protein [Clostridia bacterium]
MSYKVFYSADGVTKDITDFVTGIQYSGETGTAARKMEISVLQGTDFFVPKLRFRNGGMLILFSEGKEIMRTVVFKQDRNDKDTLKLTSYTHGIYLVKNKDTNRFEQLKASQIAEKICRDFGIETGHIEDTKLIFPKLIFRDMTLWDMIVTALTETTKRNGVKYKVLFKEGKLYIYEKRKQLVSWVLKEGVNLLGANISSSIEDMKNQIKVVGKLTREDCQNEMAGILINQKLQRLYGVMQEVREESGDNVDMSTVMQIADNMLKELGREAIEADIEAIGLDEVEAGSALQITESTTGSTGLSGIFYVVQDEHSIEGNKHTMRLKLTRTDDIPVMNYEAPG